MGRRYKGSFLSSTATSTNTAQAQPGIWPLDQQMQAKGQCLWPTPVTPPGQIAYTSPGCYTWVAPAGITAISVVLVGRGAIGGSGGQYQYCFICYCCAFFSTHPYYVSGNQSGCGGRGGPLGYRNTATVVPGTSYTVRVSGACGGANGVYGVCGGGANVVITNPNSPNGSYSTSGLSAHYPGGTGGYNASAEDQRWRFGYPPFPSQWPPGGGGGGAGGYCGSGGSGGNNYFASGSGGSGGGGGGGSGGGTCGNWGGFGGGVGLLGAGASGSGGAGPGGLGSAGSGGSGTLYGGGGRGGTAYSGGATGGNAAVRIIWPGNTRQFPSTNTGNL